MSEVFIHYKSLFCLIYLTKIPLRECILILFLILFASSVLTFSETAEGIKVPLEMGPVTIIPVIYVYLK